MGLELARRLVAVTSEREHNKRAFASGMRVLCTLGLAEYRRRRPGRGSQGASNGQSSLRDGGDAYEKFVLSMVLARQGGSTARSYITRPCAG